MSSEREFERLNFLQKDQLGQTTEHFLNLSSANRDKAIDPSSNDCLLYTSPSPRDATLSRMPSSA